MNVRDKLNIIIPLYNPHATWENYFIDSLIGLKKELNETELTVILVNDGSTTQLSNINEIIDRFEYLKYYSYPINMGKGYAIRYGVNVSDADFYVYTDIDFPFGYQILSQTYRILKSSQTNIVIPISGNWILPWLNYARLQFITVNGVQLKTCYCWVSATLNR